MIAYCEVTLNRPFSFTACPLSALALLSPGQWCSSLLEALVIGKWASAPRDLRYSPPIKMICPFSSVSTSFIHDNIHRNCLNRVGFARGPVVFSNKLHYSCIRPQVKVSLSPTNTEQSLSTLARLAQVFFVRDQNMSQSYRLCDSH